MGGGNILELHSSDIVQPVNILKTSELYPSKG